MLSAGCWWHQGWRIFLHEQKPGSPWGQELLLSFLCLAALFTKTDKDQPHRLKEEHVDQQIRTWQIWRVWERASHLPWNHREYSFLCFSLICLSELQKLPGYHFAPCSPWLASSCFSSKEQNKLCVLLHTLVQACWDLHGWGISFRGSVGRLPSHLGWEAQGQGRTDLARLALFCTALTEDCNRKVL